MSQSLPLVGVHPTATDRSLPIVELAQESEARGLRSISFPEHTHTPIDSTVLVPGWQIQERYQRTLDPFIACAWVAAVTSLEVATTVSLVAQHDAIALAKTTATLDHLSQGRFALGVGFGYNRQEVEAHGVPAKDRFLVVEETVALMRALWTEEVAAFEGHHRRLSPSWSWPKPMRPGGLPVLLGGRATEKNFARIIAWADGWIPAGMGVGSGAVGASLADLRARWDGAGRKGAPEICCLFAPGSRDDMTRELEQAAELGVQRMEVRLDERPREDVLPILDQIAVIIEELG